MSPLDSSIIAVRVAGVSEFLAVSLLCKRFGLPVVPHVGDMGQLHQHLVLFNHIALTRNLVPGAHPPPAHSVRFPGVCCGRLLQDSAGSRCLMCLELVSGRQSLMELSVPTAVS